MIGSRSLVDCQSSQQGALLILPSSSTLLTSVEQACRPSPAREKDGMPIDFVTPNRIRPFAPHPQTPSPARGRLFPANKRQSPYAHDCPTDCGLPGGITTEDTFERITDRRMMCSPLPKHTYDALFRKLQVWRITSFTNHELCACSFGESPVRRIRSLANRRYPPESQVFPRGMAHIQSLLKMPMVMHNRQWSSNSSYLAKARAHNCMNGS
eukprot:4098182-Pleurochrysis_carterae.AAC.1